MALTLPGRPSSTSISFVHVANAPAVSPAVSCASARARMACWLFRSRSTEFLRALTLPARSPFVSSAFPSTYQRRAVGSMFTAISGCPPVAADVGFCGQPVAPDAISKPRTAAMPKPGALKREWPAVAMVHPMATQRISAFPGIALSESSNPRAAATIITAGSADARTSVGPSVDFLGSLTWPTSVTTRMRSKPIRAGKPHSDASCK